MQKRSPGRRRKPLWSVISPIPETETAAASRIRNVHLRLFKAQRSGTNTLVQPSRNPAFPVVVPRSPIMTA